MVAQEQAFRKRERLAQNNSCGTGEFILKTGINCNYSALYFSANLREFSLLFGRFSWVQ
jgi:hypothetical protein